MKITKDTYYRVTFNKHEQCTLLTGGLSRAKARAKMLEKEGHKNIKVWRIDAVYVANEIL